MKLMGFFALNKKDKEKRKKNPTQIKRPQSCHYFLFKKFFFHYYNDMTLVMGNK